MIYKKKYKDYPSTRNFLHGLCLTGAYYLELECLKKIKGFPYMCQLLDYDEDELSLDLEWAGPTLETFLNEIKTHEELDDFKKFNIEDQLNQAYKILEKCAVVNFDITPHNICINEGKICIIDFGLVVFDCEPKTEYLAKRYNQMLKNGVYNYSAEKQRFMETLSRRIHKIESEIK
jgi:tRNA A-37 threonylcarbamoyl transferase component Bud32